MQKRSKIFGFLILVLALTACERGGVQRSLGLSKSTPDEFMVYSKPPLSVPPDFSLRAPESGAPTPKDSYIRESARETVFSGDKAKAPSAKPGLNQGESKLLQKAGNAPNEEKIRQMLSEEEFTVKTEKAEEGKVSSFLSKLDGSDKESIVDAEKEKERLDKNDREGKSPTDGETPVIKPSDEGIINRIIQ